VLSPVLAELLQLPAPGPPHPAAPQGGPDACAVCTARSDARQLADAEHSAAKIFSIVTEKAGSLPEDFDNEDGYCDEDGS
jgi:hypothetical protein